MAEHTTAQLKRMNKADLADLVSKDDLLDLVLGPKTEPDREMIVFKTEPVREMTACQHVEAAHAHFMTAYEMYGQSHPIDVERGRHLMDGLVLQAKNIDL